MANKLRDLDELFKGRHVERELIILCVRWYCRDKLSYRDLVEMALLQIGSANRLELSEQNELMTRDEQAEESGGVVRWTPF
jgi:hypothetical protein